MTDDFGVGYALGQDSNGGGNGGFGGSFGEGLWAIIILAMLGFGNGGFGGGYGGGGALTRAELYDGFALQNIDSAVRGVQQGICDSTYALNNSIMAGFHGVDRGLCDIGYQTQQGINTLAHQMSDCCCTTQRAIDGVNYNMAKGFCDLGNVINMQTRDIIDNQNCNTRQIMDFLVNSKIEKLQSENQDLRLRASQLDQNSVIRAAIDASTAEIIRRTGNDCPVPSYLVQPPTAVNFPTNGCGTVQFGNYGGNGCGCGCG